jgi:hypothetical protein
LENYGNILLAGLNVLGLGSFKGNIWAGDGSTKVTVALFFDEKANEQQLVSYPLLLYKDHFLESYLLSLYHIEQMISRSRICYDTLAFIAYRA